MVYALSVGRGQGFPNHFHTDFLIFNGVFMIIYHQIFVQNLILHRINVELTDFSNW
jgi:hypothetical protein